MQNKQENPMLEKDKNFCSYAGFFGILLSITCFIQLTVYGISSWQVSALFIIYLMPIIAFLFLTAKKHVSALLLIISAVFTFIAQLIWMLSVAFSLVVLLLLIYNICIVVLLYGMNIPQKLLTKRKQEKAEADAWKNII